MHEMTFQILVKFYIIIRMRSSLSGKLHKLDGMSSARVIYLTKGTHIVYQYSLGIDLPIAYFTFKINISDVSELVTNC